jgi:hypothetical protein
MDARHKGEHDGDWNNVVFMGSGLFAARSPGMTAVPRQAGAAKL